MRGEGLSATTSGTRGGGGWQRNGDQDLFMDFGSGSLRALMKFCALFDSFPNIFILIRNKENGTVIIVHTEESHHHPGNGKYGDDDDLSCEVQGRFC